MHRLPTVVLCALLAWTPAAAQVMKLHPAPVVSGSSPTIDASGVTNTDGTGVSVLSANVTTTSTNDAVVVVVQNQDPTTAATVSSITGCGLTFTKLTSAAVTGSPNAGKLNLEIWSAPSAATQAACALSTTLSASQDGFSVATFGVHGLGNLSVPLDANVGAKACVSTVSGALSSPPTLTTSSAKDLLMGFAFTIDAGTNRNWTTATWTLLYNYRYTATITYNSQVGSASLPVSVTQAATAVDLTNTANNFPVLMCGLAFSS